MRIVKAVWAYLGLTQPVFIRMLHLAVIGLVIIQLITSNFVDLENLPPSGGVLVLGFGTWTHVLPGLALVVITLLFGIAELAHRGAKYFFAYLWGDLAPLKSDLKTLFTGRLPEVSPGGLAAIVQGLGLGAMGLTLLSGGLWFLLIQTGSGFSRAAIEMHEAVTGLVVVYFIGHGGMGLLHMLLWMRKTAK